MRVRTSIVSLAWSDFQCRLSLPSWRGMFQDTRRHGSMGIDGNQWDARWSWRIDDVKIRPNGRGKLFVQTPVRRMLHRDPLP
ncbi:hypothetical protein B0T18DRAFT_402806 [Schizothecium vesticola]|uniref:Uncharacterized protein n=1 Tax=Schizothecium vesticola TaxID=314040 RepID=A0AA40F5L5_9PEZI|nr:hypothetical protein B0T18DRAFT_402806 [Schizothecium vesticola]